MLKSFTQTETPTVEGHTLTFIANSGEKMLTGETVDLATLQVSVNDGQLKPVADLTQEDTLLLPLLTDHAFTVASQAGAVTKLQLTDKGLEAAATLADNEAGTNIQQLAKAGALTNSFSVTIDYPREPGEDLVIHDAELVEISVVFRGADPRANYISINHREGSMTGKEPTDKPERREYSLDADEADQLKDAIGQAVAAIGQAVDKLTDKPENENDQDDEEKGAEPAMSQNRMPDTLPIASFDRPRWRDSEDAVREYARIMFTKDSLADKKRDYNRVVAEHEGLDLNVYAQGRYAASIGNDDVQAFIPQPVITEIQDSIADNTSGLWQMYNHTGFLHGFRAGANLDGVETDNGRAHGYKPADYGTVKKKQVVKPVHRDILPDMVYKYFDIDRGNLIRANDANVLLDYVLKELPARIVATMERQSIFGGFSDMDFIRGVLTDANDNASPWRGTDFCSKLQASAVPDVGDFVQASATVTAQGKRVLVTARSVIANLKTAKAADGHLVYPVGTDFAALMDVDEIITPEWFTQADLNTLLGVILVPNAYDTVGRDTIDNYADFSLTTNTNQYLQELYIGGGLAKRHAAAVVTPPAASPSGH